MKSHTWRTKHTWKTQLAGLLLIVSAARAHAAETPRVYKEDFSLGVAGWTSLSTASHVASGGVDGGGYLKASRDNVFPGQHRITAEAGTFMSGNLKENFGTNRLDYSFYVKMIHPPINKTLSVALENETTWWVKPVATAGTDWTHVAMSIDTNWSDAAAARNGWQRHGGTASWKDVCSQVVSQSFAVASPVKPDERPFETGFDNVMVSGRVVSRAKPVPKGKTAAPDSGYVDKVRTMLDNMIDYGRDRYGREHSPLFAAILDEDTLDCPEDPPAYPTDAVRLDPGRFENRRAPGGGDVYFDQAMLKSMDLMTRRTGEPRYRQAALDALRFAMNRAVDSKGFPAVGGHMYWHLHNDALACQGEFHELWNWPLAWDLWWAADSEKMKRYAHLMWDWHVFDKSTGEINRHSDRKKGYAFSFTSASIMSQWGFVAERTELEPYRSWCRTVAGYHWAGRNPRTHMFDSAGGQGPSGLFTTMQATVARDWILVGRQTDDDELVRQGRAILDNYAKYGFDETTGLFYAALNLDGTPREPKAERPLVTGDQSRPLGYLAVWQPHVAWQEEPLAMAQAYAWAAEQVDRETYLSTAARFGRIIQKAWHERFAGSKDWFALADRLQPLAVEYYKIGGVLHSRQSASAKVDPQAMTAYLKGGYVYQAPFGMFADHYGRMIQFSLSMHRLTDDRLWLHLAREAADEAVRELWRGKIFVGHVQKKHYMNTDHVGILLHALLQLEGALGENQLKIEPLF